MGDPTNKVVTSTLDIVDIQEKIKDAEHSGSSTLDQILPVIRFAWKAVAEMAENLD